jgi:hypothetical protein
MIQKYPCKKDQSFGIFLLISSVIIIGFAYGLPILTNDKYSFKELIITSLFVIAIICLLLWCWFDTYYLIDKETLIAKCGPFIWRVPISEITLIRLNQKTIGGTFKPTLSWKSIEIQYKTYRSIYVTPDKIDEFLSHIENTNDKIEIKQN